MTNYSNLSYHRQAAIAHGKHLVRVKRLRAGFSDIAGVIVVFGAALALLYV